MDIQNIRIGHIINISPKKFRSDNPGFELAPTERTSSCAYAQSEIDELFIIAIRYILGPPIFG